MNQKINCYVLGKICKRQEKGARKRNRETQSEARSNRALDERPLSPPETAFTARPRMCIQTAP